jgi:hypothetical protein
VLIHFDSTTNATPLTSDRSRGVLEFCRAVGATVFTVNFLYVKGEDSERLAQQFYQRLASYSAGDRVLENVGGARFSRQRCWLLDHRSIEFILNETGGNLFAYNMLVLPEDWLFYVGNSILLQVVSNEQEATLRISEEQYAAFRELGIPHEPGCSQWSGLPEAPRK